MNDNSVSTSPRFLGLQSENNGGVGYRHEDYSELPTEEIIDKNNDKNNDRNSEKSNERNNGSPRSIDRKDDRKNFNDDKNDKIVKLNEGSNFYLFLTAIKVVFLCSLFMLVGPALILLNKYILHDLNFPFPLFISSLGILLSSIVAKFIVYLGYVTIEKKDEVEGIYYYKRVLPVGVAYAGTLATGNLVYLFLDVGFIQMLKSFTPVVVMIFLYFTGIEFPNKQIIISILIISFGTALTCTYTPNASVLGMIIMLMSEIFEAVRLVLTQFLLKDVKMGVVEGQCVLSPPTALCLLILSFFFEIPNMIETGRYVVLYKNFNVLFISALLGVIVNFLTYFVIQVSSSLSLKIMVMFRNFFVIIIGILMYHEATTFSEIVGYFFALIGFAGYNAAKMKIWVSDNDDSCTECSLLGTLLGTFHSVIDFFNLRSSLNQNEIDNEFSNLKKNSNNNSFDNINNLENNSYNNNIIISNLDIEDGNNKNSNNNINININEKSHMDDSDRHSIHMKNIRDNYSYNIHNKTTNGSVRRTSEKCHTSHNKKYITSNNSSNNNNRNDKIVGNGNVKLNTTSKDSSDSHESTSLLHEQEDPSTISTMLNNSNGNFFTIFNRKKINSEV